MYRVLPSFEKHTNKIPKQTSLSVPPVDAKRWKQKEQKKEQKKNDDESSQSSGSRRTIHRGTINKEPSFLCLETKPNRTEPNRTETQQKKANQQQGIRKSRKLLAITWKDALDDDALAHRGLAVPVDRLLRYARHETQ